MIKKSPNTYRLISFLLLSVMLVQCQSAPGTPTLAPIIAQEQPATIGNDVEIVAFLSDYLDDLAENHNFNGQQNQFLPNMATVLKSRTIGLVTGEASKDSKLLCSISQDQVTHLSLFQTIGIQLFP